MIRVFIGFDRNETVACSVLSHSIQRTSSQPVATTPLILPQLTRVHRRPRHHLQSTEFSFTRFLVPYLCGYRGWAVFMDCDMLCRRDIGRLWALRDDSYSVLVVRHDHRPTNAVKFNNHRQTRYAKKNWSSVMLFNCSRCTALTPQYVEEASGLMLHQFKWLSGDHEIGALPRGWNHLVGYDPYDPGASLVHFTEGGPYFEAYRRCDFADEWFACRKNMLSVHDADARQQEHGASHEDSLTSV